MNSAYSEEWIDFTVDGAEELQRTKLYKRVEIRDGVRSNEVSERCTWQIVIDWLAVGLEKFARHVLQFEIGFFAHRNVVLYSGADLIDKCVELVVPSQFVSQVKVIDEYIRFGTERPTGGDVGSDPVDVIVCARLIGSGDQGFLFFCSKFCEGFAAIEGRSIQYCAPGGKLKHVGFKTTGCFHSRVHVKAQRQSLKKPELEAFAERLALLRQRQGHNVGRQYG